MESYKPYCYLYKDIPNEGDLFVSTVVELPAGKNLDRPTKVYHGSTTTVTYSLKSSVGLLAGIRTPIDEKITWDGTERIVKVVVNSGTAAKQTTLSSTTAD